MRPIQSQSFLPLLEFPSKVVLVDDNIDFIKSLQLFFSYKGVELNIFSDPKKALIHLQEHAYYSFVDKYLKPDDHEDLFSKKVSINLNSVHQEINNPKRFDEISAVIVDYAMPGINGQEFCEKIAHLPLQKLLLTGEASYKKAVEMFNNRTINQFIKKEEDSGLLFDTTADLQNKYFQNVTQNLLFALKNSDNNSIFSDPAFIEFFKSLCKENNFSEYYVLDECGSYLLADRSGLLKVLIVKSDQEMQILYEIAEGDAAVTKEILQKLRTREKITFFQSGKELALPTTQWNLHDAHCIEGKQTYYYALIDAGSDFRLDKD